MIITYKKCKISDLTLLIDIAKTTFIDAFESSNNPEDFKAYMTSAFNKKQIKRELLNSNCAFYLAYVDDTLVGYFKLNEKEAQQEIFSDSSIELERIYVLEAFQKQQIGKQLLFKAVEIAKSKRVDFLWLGVWEHNSDAIRFYKKYGFTKFGTHPYYLGTDKQTDWLLRLIVKS